MLGQPGGHVGGEALVDVLDDDDWRGEALGQAREDRRQCRRTAGRGADRNQWHEAVAPSGAPTRAGAVGMAGEPPQRRHLGEQRTSSVERMGGSELRRVDGVERAIPHCRKHAPGMVFDIGGDDQDRTGSLGHDPSGRLDAIHHRHDQVHQHQIGQRGRAHPHRFGAVGSGPQHLMLGGGGDDPAQRLQRGGRIVDDRDLHGVAVPMRSTTAWISPSLWKLPLVR